ncbi:hypothetical protein ACS5PU_16940 [Pedobacter sp. GSP4]|uniref:hypothetical protein n=1 Tax=Pedobacter sp. GSP4 TaxID=3453716 RepID=UPI003EEFBCC7
MDNKNKEKQSSKAVLIENDDLRGSDADKAYDENGNFEKENFEGQETLKKGPEKNDVSQGADADS